MTRFSPSRGEDCIQASVCAARVIASVSPVLRCVWNLPEHAYSVGLVTCDFDDVAYIAADEATKHADVEVCVGSSLYAGSRHSSSPTAGEVIVALAGPNPSEVRAGVDRMVASIEGGPCFRWASRERGTAYLAHVVARTGSYLSGLAGCAEGSALAYLIAPPLEAMFGLDAALKAANVHLARYFAPPSPTNFGGALLVGAEAACAAACEAFQGAALDISRVPVKS